MPSVLHLAYNRVILIGKQYQIIIILGSTESPGGHIETQIASLLGDILTEIFCFPRPGLVPKICILTSSR
jgi:hypothetical protein